MRPIGTARQLEKRRIRGIELLKEGVGPYEVARRLNVAPKTVYRWRDSFEASGLKGLAPRARVGIGRKLTPSQEKRLIDLLVQGPIKAGYRTDLWTTRRVAALIRKTFGVKYSAAHMSRLLKRLGWSAQKPLRRSAERDQAAIDDWLKSTWPRVKKSAGRDTKRSPSSTRAASQ